MSSECEHKLSETNQIDALVIEELEDVVALGLGDVYSLVLDDLCELLDG